MNIKLIFGIVGVILSVGGAIEIASFVPEDQLFASAALGWMFAISIFLVLEGLEICKHTKEGKK